MMINYPKLIENDKIKQYGNSLDHCTITVNYFCESTMNNCKTKVLVSVSLFLATLMSLTGNAWAWNHYHGGGGGGWGYRGPGYYGPGYYPGWGGPNVIINVPIAPVPPPPVPYVRECETVQICNEYDECWLERQCN